jgi:serine/threonine protein kinase
VAKWSGPNKKRKIEVAIKRIQKSRVNLNPSFTQMLENELDLIQKLNSKHIVQFIDVQHTSTHYYFVFELCPMGDLHSYIRK